MKLFRMRMTLPIGILITLIVVRATGAADRVKTEEDRQREAAIAEFTAKMKAANYPALFEQAATEFNVPADILKGVAFAETRWEHLTWPPGETRSPETGMPRPFGIMSLWDNEFFGHSLTDAAQLIGKSPEDLKQDPLSNIRGAAALLRKIYDETAKPDGTTAQDIESWRYAIVKYCGIPEPDLSHRHGLDVYEFMNKGYNQYGIEWKARAVNLDPMRAEVKRIVAEEAAKREAQMKAAGLLDEHSSAAASPIPAAVANSSPPVKVEAAPVTVRVVESPTPAAPAPRNGIWWLVGALMLVLIGGLLAWRRQSKSPPPRNRK